jgi:oxygen-dependent protoporphyrinogen oxidase
MRVVVVGGGISGLALAYRLEQAGAEVVVLERRDRTGGTIDSVRREDFLVEAGPNGFFDTTPAARGLCDELGIGGRLVPASEAAGKNRYLFLDGKLRALPAGLFSFLTSRVLSWRGKLALLRERFRPPRREEGDESVDAFARRRAGDEAADVLADAFISGILAGDAKLLSVQSAFPRLATLEREHGSVMRGMAVTRKQKRAEARARGEAPPGRARTWSFPEGLGLLTDTLAGRLGQPPRTGVVVRSLSCRENAGGPSPLWEVTSEGGENWQADAVALTCPAYGQAEILRGVDEELAARVGEIPYNRLAVVALGYQAADVPHPLDGFGYLTPGRAGRDVLGVQWCSTIFPGRAPPGRVLLRAICGGWFRPEVVDWEEGRLVEAVRAELRLALGITEAPAFHHIVRWDRAIPQYHLGHAERLRWIDERLARHPGLFLGGNSYRGVALNDCVEQAGVLAGRVAGYLHRTTQPPNHPTT